MTKSEIREMKSINMYLAAGMRDTAARALSTLVRGARTNKSRDALLFQAYALRLRDLPEFIIS